MGIVFCAIITFLYLFFVSGTMDAMFDNDCGIPCLIMFYILSRLDPFVVYNMRMVSKNWNNSVKDKEFIRYYDEHSKISRKCRFLTCQMFPRGIFHNLFFTMSVADMSTERCIQLKPHPLCKEFHNFVFVGVIDGLICMRHISDMEHGLFVISNPFTGRNISISTPMMMPNNRKFS